METMTPAQVREMLLACADKIIRNEPYLTRVDSAIGDGDHGIGMVFSEVCHSCGGCALLCPKDAVSEKPHSVGAVEEGTAGSVRVVTGIMNTGEVLAVPVIKAALRAGAGAEELTVIDCPPGSGCPVMESVMMGSRPVTGSSRRSSFFMAQRARASSTRCCWPPERSR